MSARRLKDVHVVALAGVLTVVLGGAAAFITPLGGPGSESPSSFSAAAAGGRPHFSR